MKNIALVLLFIIPLISNPLEWSNNYHMSRQKARKEHKDILLFISSKNNPNCEYMEKDTFTNKKVEKYIKMYYIPVRITIEDDRIPFGIKFFATPSVYLLTPSGEDLHTKIVGLITVHKMQDILLKIKKQKSLPSH